MKREELQRLWREANVAGAEPPASGASPPATFMSAPSGAAEALLGADLAAVGLPLGGWSGAPAAVRAASQRYAGWLASAARETGLRVVDYGDIAVDAADLGATFVRAHERLADVLAAGAMPLLLGGDAAVTVPVLQVLSGKLRGRLGIIAFAPRLDLEVESGRVASSRWARALELGVVEPRNLVVIGERGGPGEAQARRVCDALEARRCSLADVTEAGIVTVAREALQAASTGTEALYISVDLGVVEGVEDPVGLSASDLSVALGIVTSSRMAGADLCAVVPRDVNGAPSAALAARLAADVVVAVARQRA
jgi:arginase family enzyme